NRVFLGWRRPALVSAAQWLLERADGADTAAADLSQVTVVVPGARARRMCMGALVDAAQGQGRALTPPMVITPGEVPATLLGKAGTPAGALARRMAWVRALRSIDPVALTALLP